jgi:hypothetical protein
VRVAAAALVQVAAQDPPAYDALWVCLCRLVEHRCRGSAPVDQQHVVVVVAQSDPADVARDVADLRAHVEASEDQALVGGVQGRHPAGRLEDHGVALDEATLVPDPAAGEPLGRQRLRRQSSLLHLAVHGVDVVLLDRDLASGNVTVQRGCPP